MIRVEVTLPESGAKMLIAVEVEAEAKFWELPYRVLNSAHWWGGTTELQSVDTRLY